MELVGEEVRIPYTRSLSCDLGYQGSRGGGGATGLGVEARRGSVARAPVGSARIAGARRGRGSRGARWARGVVGAPWGQRRGGAAGAGRGGGAGRARIAGRGADAVGARGAVGAP